ncbi:MAG: glycoside hydrolase family 65 protein [Candidatus Omnitrophica bacterium]|nr:glycoside hydrolase family 65 protein [Candidatus Omnitrophota bacterium]MBU0896454.1 glycoside hydrolase family 65 protein [Candidatus Omnitrophota bacterium]MBU1134205.1 glycoside hydrolase family 65 protein [Candidatus Omnitrophota bacterium]MBU1810335.1 glycoside hydrolase family 65 protein [Candidatus Omnitrophota bacterium]
MKESTWTLVYNQFSPEQEGLREALCTLGNGYFATRGAAPEAVASKIHYPGTYIAGVYNRLSTHIAGRIVVNEDLVNCPNWTFLTFKIGKGEWFSPSKEKILFYRQELNMHDGVLRRKILFQTKHKQKTLIETERIAHMASAHYGAIKYVITPLNYSEWITVRTMLDGTVLNAGVERYRQLNSKHWKPHSLGGFTRNGTYLSVKTTQSRVEVAQAARIRIFVGEKEKRSLIRQLMKGKERVGQEFRVFARQNHCYTIEKVVSIYTSKDKGVRNPAVSAMEALKKPLRFNTLFRTHYHAWEKLWKKFDIQIEGDNFSQRTLRLHTFHLLQTASSHNIDIDAGLPARGLHGEAYRGHIFWDEVFALHLYDFHLPEVSQALLLYRYQRLAMARKYAQEEGYRGAMFPWQSGSSGREETQVVHLNPLSGKWGLDYSRLQRHVSFAIAYNVWRHYQITDSWEFLLRFGAEIILSIAQFAASLAKYDPQDGKFHTKKVMGPDEFHEKLAGSSKPGLKDNAYTNLMIVWILLRAEEILNILPVGNKEKILKKLGLKERELCLWKTITRKMNLIINSQGIIAQFEGYFDLKELDWPGYRAEYGDVHRMDRILKAEGQSPDDYKVSKQADTLMAFYLLSLGEVKEILGKLGYNFDKELARKNYEYYVKRTSHGSTLSKVTHCFIAQALGKKKEAWRWFREVLESDIHDTQGGTTPEGIHVGVMGGSLDIVVRAFAGINILEDRIKISPNLPKNWRSLKLKIYFRGRWISLSFTKRQLVIFIEAEKAKLSALPIEIQEKIYHFPIGKKFKIPLKKAQKSLPKAE